MEQDVGFLEQEDQPMSSDILAEVQRAAKKMGELRVEMDIAEETFKQAKKNYDTYRCVTLPNIMKMHDIDMIRLRETGAVVEVVKKYYCSPNKNEEDRRLIYEWLEKVGGKSLIKEEAKVSAENKEKLIEAQIPFDLRREVNTNTLKAWLKDQTGGNGGQMYIDPAEIPQPVHFIIQDECEIKMR